jgi:predicted Zn-dependent peptidase
MSQGHGFGEVQSASLELDNGLRASAIELPALHRSVISAQIRVGSAYESATDNGISHFLEHMLFRGTPRHPSAYQLAQAFEALGGTLEAATSEDYGFLSISVPPESLLAALDIFCEVVKQPLLTDLEVERGIVREEILEGLDELGQDIDAAARCRRLCFGDHALGQPIAGTLEALDTFDRDRLLAHHARHYSGANVALVVAGPLKGADVLGGVRRWLGTLSPGAAPGTALPAEQCHPRFGFFKHKASQTSLSVCYRAPGRASQFEPAIEMLLRILDDGMSTRLYHRVCEELGLCYDAGAGYQAFERIGTVEFAAETAHGRAATLLEEILKIAAELADRGPRRDEIDRAQRRARWQYQAMLDEPEAMAHFYAQAALEQTGQTPETRVEQLCSVDRDMLIEAAQAIFRPQNRNVFAVGLQRTKELDRLDKLARTTGI